jgi:hypothetical protein
MIQGETNVRGGGEKTVPVLFCILEKSHGQVWDFFFVF